MEIKLPAIEAVTAIIEQEPLIQYVLHLADNSLVMGHRLSEWAGHGPLLEQDIAMSNIALDHIGQSRNFYQYASQLIGNEVSEDTLAYFREANQFKNCIITELPNGDWGKTIMKLFLFSTYQQLLYTALTSSKDTQIAAIATKSLKEVLYHVRWSSEWVIRLGDGTENSRKRMINAVNEVWTYIEELFIPASFEETAAGNGIGIALYSLHYPWFQKVSAIFSEATLDVPTSNVNQLKGKEGKHSEHLQVMLIEMQILQRTYPGCEW